MASEGLVAIVLELPWWTRIDLYVEQMLDGSQFDLRKPGVDFHES